MRVLVAYASEHGSTREIAERVAVRLRDRGLWVDCRDLAEEPDGAGYDAVVLGSAVHNGHWLPWAQEYLHRHAAAMNPTPTWLFSVGMPDALAAPLRRMAMREGSTVVAEFLREIAPRDVRLFSGVIRREHLPASGAAALRLLGGHFGDFRDWAAIDSWADGIDAALRATAGPPAVTKASPVREMQER
jgi:menaquinone-dependent protoporphyrinogen oxidase